MNGTNRRDGASLFNETGGATMPEIELWFADNALNIDRLQTLMVKVAQLPPGTEIPVAMVRTERKPKPKQ